MEAVKMYTAEQRLDFLQENFSLFLCIAGTFYSRLNYGKPYKKHKNLIESIDYVMQENSGVTSK